MGDYGCHTWIEVYLPTFGDGRWLTNWVAAGRGNRFEIMGQWTLIEAIS